MTKAAKKVYPPIRVGDRFGRQEVVAPAPARQPGSRPYWMVRCDCGRTRPVPANTLKEGTSSKCKSCSRRARPPRTSEQIQAHAAKIRKHGQARSPTYRAWLGMRSRCTNPNNQVYRLYGGRGIRVDSVWSASYEAFVRDMGERPGPGYSIDRYPDNDGNYEPGNCRWATCKEQLANRRVTTMVDTPDGPRALSDLTGDAVVPHDLVQMRVVRLGWSVERAKRTPSLNPTPRGPRRKRTV